MEDLIKELKELRATLKTDGYKDWCYAQLTIDKAIKAVENCNLAGATIPVKIINPMEITWFNDIVKLNKWYGDGKYCEIIAMNYDNTEGVHYVHYRLK